MKKLLLVLAMFVAITSMTFAAGNSFNPQVEANASFTATVILPLVASNGQQASLDLPKGIAGQNRTGNWGPLYVYLDGEANAGITITNHLTPVLTGTAGTVTLTPSWGYANGTYALDEFGAFTQTFSVTSIDASLDARGTFSWQVTVDAVYSGI